ncbi:kinase-like protein [Aspergillus minisclerotigenes]|uniref:non-specific serine/threonine protein kinase n=1 Tax=Aspergillus minisclerotigenes TaxID=656917 RepID=A0A5N6IWD5_9EURO|nr:kinase-like protein [Aspergillus minisclerotigenes]
MTKGEPYAPTVPYFEYQPIEGVERLERYRPGGYHPIHIGDVLKVQYRVVHKLGHGAYSTIWLSRDEQQAVYVAVKISTGDSSPHEADILCAIANSPEVDDPGRSMIPIIQDRFEIQGPNGCHKCYLTPPAQSSTARALVAELVLAVAYIHAQGIVHGDIHLGNALIRLPTSFDRLSVEQLYQKFGEPYTEAVMRLDGQPLPAGTPARGTVPVWLGKKANEVTLAEAHLLLSDFGEAFSPTDSQQKRRGDHSRPLFDATLATHDDISSQQVDILGPLPLESWDSWEVRHEYFEERGEPKKDRFIFPSLEHCFEKEIHAPRDKIGMGGFDRDEMVAILTMLRSMLAFKPEERATAKAVLGSDWMVTWGLPEFEKIRQT